MNLPNKITISRICMIPVFGAIFFIDFPYHYFVSALVFIVAACTDFVDGHIARKYNLVTNLGKFLDPIADKVLVSTALIFILVKPEILTVLWGGWTLVFAGVCVAVILARELIVSGFRMVAASTGLVLAADKVGKLKTTFQDIAIAMRERISSVLRQRARLSMRSVSSASASPPFSPFGRAYPIS